MQFPTDLSRARDTVVGVLEKHCPGFLPRLCIVLGSGLRSLERAVQAEFTFDTNSVPGWPRTSAPGHAGTLVTGSLSDTPVLLLCGRIHRYEGFGLDEVLLPVRVALALGCKQFILTSAVGSCRHDYGPGTIVQVTDHIDLPLGRPESALSRSTLARKCIRPYSTSMGHEIALAAAWHGIKIVPGVLATTVGPNYETAAEVRALIKSGADAVGMSSTTESAFLALQGAQVALLSYVTNYATGLNEAPISHADVLSLGERTAINLEAILTRYGSTARPDAQPLG